MGSVVLSDNKLLGYTLSGLSEIPGGIIVIPLLHFIGRRTVSFVSFFLQGTAMLISPFLRSKFQFMDLNDRYKQNICEKKR